MTVGWFRMQHAKAPAVLVFLALLAFETVRYSAHHLGHLNRPTQCAVASASTHLTGVAVNALTIDPPTQLSEILSGIYFADPSIIRLSPTKGRAPPSFTA